MKSRTFCAASGWLLRLTLLAAVTAAGCGNSGGTSQTTTAGGVPMAISGAVHGGQNPVAGAAVYVYQGGSSGYGRGDVRLACTTTATNGQFSFGSTSPLCTGSGLPAAFSCPASGSPNLYLVAVGGNPGAGTNAALVMMVALGACNGPVVNGFVTVNEVTTAASVWALSQFMNCSGGAVNGPAGGCTSNSRDVGAAATNAVGFGNAMALEANLANPSTGLAQITSPNINVPSAAINTVADILQDCINSTGAASTACNNLFTCAVPGAKPGPGNVAPCTLPSGVVAAPDTLAAALDIARNPANNVAALFNLTSKAPAFTPALASSPNNWTMALVYTGGGLNVPMSVAIDGSGNAWFANFTTGGGSVTEISPTGSFLTGASGLTGGGLASPLQIAIDPAGNAWVANCGSGCLTVVTAGAAIKISPARAFLSGSAGFVGGGLMTPEAIAIDASGNAWISGSQVTVEVSPTGTFLTGADGLTGGGLNQPGGTAIDGAGNIWVSNFNANTITEFTPPGVFLSGPNGYAGGTLNEPKGVAIDAAGNVWIANVTSNSISELSPTGVPISPAAGFMGGGMNDPIALAIDPAGIVWIANEAGNSLVELSPTGRFLSGAAGFPGAGLSNPSAVAIDAGGDVWLPNQGNNRVTEFVGLATPVLTPMSACLARKTGHAVCLP